MEETGMSNTKDETKSITGRPEALNEEQVKELLARKEQHEQDKLPLCVTYKIGEVRRYNSRESNISNEPKNVGLFNAYSA